MGVKMNGAKKKKDSLQSAHVCYSISKKSVPHNLMQVMNRPACSGRFNFTNQFPHYKEVMYKPDFRNRIRGMPVIFDMDMSPGDFIALLCLLKANIEAIDLKVRIICV
jgi:hypothetical protein